MSDTKQKFIDAVVKGIAELPDRSSPEGHPELMQCTAEEVVDVLLVVYREHIAALEADAARYKQLQMMTWNVSNVSSPTKADALWTVSFYSSYGATLDQNNIDTALDAMKGGA